MCKTKKRTRAMAMLMLLVMLFSTVASFTGQMLQLPSLGGVTVAQAADNFGLTVGSDGSVSVDQNNKGSLTSTTNTFKTIVTWVCGICTVAMLLFMILCFTKLGAARDNEQERRKAIAGILTTGIATALLGSVTIWFAFFYRLINDNMN